MSSDGLPTLQVVSGPASGKRFALDENALEIGRGTGGDGTLGGDPHLSRQHARISAFKDGRLLVEDLGSSNGTFVNGGQIAGATVLRPGDTVKVGDSELRVVAPASVGVHEVPNDLMSVILARAPVELDWVIKAGLTAFPIVVAINFVLRSFAVEYFGVRHDLPTMRPYVLLIISFMPTAGNVLGFYKNFNRSAHQSVAHYLVPTLMISCTLATVEVLLLPANAKAIEYVVTVAVAVVAPTVVVPTMLGLRVRARLTAEREVAALRAGSGSAP